MSTQANVSIPISATIDSVNKVNFACSQNDVQTLRELSLQNDSDEDLANVVVTLRTTPPVIREKTWNIDIVRAQSVHKIENPRVSFDTERLAGLNESELGELHVTVDSAGFEPIAEHKQIELLARDEWGGIHDMAQLLAAFVSPNESEIAALIKEASRLLEASGHDGALDGYQSKDPRRAYLLAGAIWSAASALGLTYAEPPASFELSGQKVRSPSQIVKEGLATCLDTVLLLAAAFEAIGLNSVVLFADGHAWVGVWIQQKDFGKVSENDVVEVRKAVQAHELISIETTLLTNRPAVGFGEAETQGRFRLAENRETEFLTAIDIARSRAARIRPLASHQTQTQTDAPAHQPHVAASLPEVPDFGFLLPEEEDEEPTTEQGRIERWQRKLLDLSLRNRLLNFVHGKQTVPLTNANLATLEDALAEGETFRLVSMHDDDPVGSRTLSPEQQRSVELTFAKEAFEKKQIAIPLSSDEMEKRLLTLYRKVKGDIQEGGTNTLFLAAGFVRWRRGATEQRNYRAPLLLIPVKLTRKSAQSPFYMAHHEDDVCINYTLLEFLKRDFDINVTAFDSELPYDHSGVDVARVLATMRQRVKEITHFEVTEDLALSTFSFSKYLLWKDMVDRTERLRENRLVKHLIDGAAKQWDGPRGSSAVQPQDIDRRQSLQTLFTPLPADSSQLAAVIAAAEGEDFYLVGPPGTGKSQTISNIIAQCLASQKTVLFVAEKSAALDVVHRRLVANGLGDGVLELHSNKSDRRIVLNQLGRAWDRASSANTAEWERATQSLSEKRDELNAYVEGLHTKGTQGFSVFDAIGCVADGQEACFKLTYESKDAHDEKGYQNLITLANETGRIYSRAAKGINLELIGHHEWSLQWADEIVDHAKTHRDAVKTLLDACTKLGNTLGLTGDERLSIERSRKLQALLPRIESELELADVPDISNAKLEEHAKALDTDFAELAKATERTIGSFPLATIRSMPLEHMVGAWRQAQTKIWPFSALATRKLRKELESYSTNGKADATQDLDALATAHAHDAAIKNNPLLAIVGADSAENLDRTLATVRETVDLRAALDELYVDVEDSSRHAVAVKDLAATRSSTIRTNLSELNEVVNQLAVLESNFIKLGGIVPSDGDSASVQEGLDNIISTRSRLADWLTWVDVRDRANAQGLTPLVDALIDGTLDGKSTADLFVRAYASWWLRHAVTDNDSLRSFRAWNHEEHVESFRKLDEQVAELSAEQILHRISHGLPDKDEVARKSELGVLRHQLNLQRPSMPIRRLLESLEGYFNQLVPCVLMSPLSIAQYLPAAADAFDVVIFDEASQITTWDAIGAIARGTQTVVVGDPKQLPPTNFFGRTEDEDEDLPELEKDMPSILDEVAAAGVPKRQLNWHYRSRDEALIAFSNRAYYDGALVTFPAPTTNSTALQFNKIAGTYVRGSSGRVNHIEAGAVASTASELLRSWLQEPEDQRFTLGVITFNTQQQSLILDLLDKERRDNPDIEWFFSDDREEPVIVKNLENIQGDERDVMLLSVTFGPDKAGKLSMNFGPLNNSGGEKRLNVAITRARRQLQVFSSIEPDQIDLGRTQAQGVVDLKTFLDFAKRGEIALAAADEGSLGSFDSPFEEAVAEAFTKLGWRVRTQVGVSGFRIDLGIVHPDRPGAYLCGIECDGATYHSSATARDRDKIRQAVLEGLGWTIIRIWSTDWFSNADAIVERIHQEMNELLESDRLKNPIVQESEETLDDDPEPESMPAVEDGLTGVETSESNASVSVTVDSARFFDTDYSPVLQELIRQIVRENGPLPVPRLASEVANMHGWNRTGKRISQQVHANLSGIQLVEEFGKEYAWLPDTYSPRVPFNGLKGRSLRDISRTEIASLIDDNIDAINNADDSLRVIADSLGISRFTQDARDYLRSCMSWWEETKQT